ncbi:hypothetical protein [Streptomyces sp. NPDC056682]|uniref:hypothetical protein n=1 Tax=Streptomyces sp. NPDC056682 TaxID=3345909 RepID=UPI0036CADB47
MLQQLTKTVLESALEGEITDHLGYDKHDPAGKGPGASEALMQTQRDWNRTYAALTHDPFRTVLRRRVQLLSSRIARHPCWGSGTSSATVESSCAAGLAPKNGRRRELYDHPASPRRRLDGRACPPALLGLCALPPARAPLRRRRQPGSPPFPGCRQVVEAAPGSPPPDAPSRRDVTTEGRFNAPAVLLVWPDDQTQADRRYARHQVPNAWLYLVGSDRVDHDRPR